MAKKQIVILGGGTGGTMAANRLRRRFDADEAEIHVVDRDDWHVYEPGLLFVPFGMAQLDEIAWPATQMMKRQMEKIVIPPISEFIELGADSGVRLYACKATVDMFGLTMDDFVPQVEDIISVGEFYEQAAGGEIIFT